MLPFYSIVLPFIHRRPALEGCVGVHQPDGPGKNDLIISVHELVVASNLVATIVKFLLTKMFWHLVFAGDAENEEPACRGDDHQEEEK